MVEAATQGNCGAVISRSFELMNQFHSEQTTTAWQKPTAKSGTWLREDSQKISGCPERELG